ncbi:MAG: twin-arginine translocation signal domain-containing protein, partial [Opitutae bacterium]|nr:twin-arginine translocation signal domain-containing protein [Opitutae bacterium]
MKDIPSSSRRKFLKTGSALSASTLLAAPHVARATKNDKTLKIGLVGIGGRGSGAAV